MTDRSSTPPTGAVLGLASIGLGWWGNELAKAATRSGAGRIVSCFARTEETRKDFATTHGCEEAESLEAVLEHPDVDGLLVATPHSNHRPVIEAAAAAGKHVFIEKPLTVSVAEGRAAVDAARRAGIVLQVGHHRRRSPAMRALRAAVDAGELGLVHLLEATHLSSMDLEPRTGWRADPEESPLGGMTGLGVHQIDNFHYLDGAVGEVFTMSRQLLGHGALDDVTTLSMEMASGALATLGTSVVLPKGVSVGVYGTGGAAWSEADGEEFFFQQMGEPGRERRPIESVDPVAQQLTEFADCVRHGRDPEVGGEEALEVVVVLEAARISASSRRPVNVDEVRRGDLTFG